MQLQVARSMLLAWVLCWRCNVNLKLFENENPVLVFAELLCKKGSKLFEKLRIIAPYCFI